MRAIIPVAGIGTRLRPHTHTIPKALVQVAGKPILGHIIDQLVPLGITDVVLVTGYMGDRVREYVAAAYPDLAACYVHQEERKGLGHAIFLTKECLDDAPSLIILGDTIVTADFESLVAEPRTAIGVKSVADPRRFGVVEVADGLVKSLVEKPDVPPSNLAIVGLYLIQNTALLMESLGEVVDRDIRTKGEYQLTDALKLMLERGERMEPFEVEGWHDCGRPSTLLETNRFLLERAGDGVPDFPGCVVIPPVSIDSDALLSNSIVGPYVSIAAGSTVRNSIVQDSIVNASAHVDSSLLRESLIGEGAVVRGHYQKLNVGDSSEIDFGGSDD